MENISSVKNVKIAIIGGGPAGLAAALGAVEGGVKPSDILIIERDSSAAYSTSAYTQASVCICSRRAFGSRVRTQIHQQGKGRRYSLCHRRYDTVCRRDKTVTYVSPHDGLVKLRAEAVILAMAAVKDREEHSTPPVQDLPECILPGLRRDLSTLRDICRVVRWLSSVRAISDSSWRAA